MFTGLVEQLGKVVLFSPYQTQGAEVGETLHQMVVECVDMVGAVGDSIAVNGVCLTLTKAASEQAEVVRLSFDVGAETLRVSCLQSLLPGSEVNLESALTLQTPLGGHLVSGHVDDIGVVSLVEDFDDGSRLLRVDLQPVEPAWVIPKGSICIQGVSLTINKLTDRDSACTVEFLLIPTTLSKTNLTVVGCGDQVNVEYDLVGKYAVRHHQISTS